MNVFEGVVVIRPVGKVTAFNVGRSEILNQLEVKFLQI
jgi:hypothetical protein